MALKSEIDPPGQSRYGSRSNGDVSANLPSAVNSTELEIDARERDSILDWRFKLFDLFALIRRHFWLIIAIMILTTLAAGLAVGMLTDRYKATALLTSDQTEARLLGSDDSATPSIDSEVEIMKSFNIAHAVAERLKLDHDPEFGSSAGSIRKLLPLLGYVPGTKIFISADSAGQTPASPDTRVEAGVSAVSIPMSAAVRTLAYKVTISRIGMTDVIAVNATSRNPQLAARISNTYAQVYLEQRLAAKARSFARAEAALTRRIDELRSALTRPESQTHTQELFQDALLRREALLRQHSAISPGLRIVAAAAVPAVPFFPPRTLLTLLGSVFGFFLALVVVYVRDARGRTVQTDQELETITRVRNIGLIPKSSYSKYAVDEAVDRPMSEFSEAVRRLYFTLSILQHDFSANTVLVTSAHPRAGRTTVALSLARAAALAGQNVVVVDCNLRQPRVHLRLKLNNNFGLAELLAEESKPVGQVVVQDDPKSSCKILTAGKIENIPADRLFRIDKFDEVLRKLVLEYDLVVLDVSNEPLADSLILMQKADMVLVVVRSGKTTFRDVEGVFRQLENVRNSNVFTVLNFVQ